MTETTAFRIFTDAGTEVHIGARIQEIMGNLWELKGCRMRADGPMLVVLYDGFLNADTWGLRERRPAAFGLHVEAIA